MFLDKLKRFIRKDQEKETLKIEYASRRNEYYGRVADHYGTVQMLLLVLLTIVVLVSLLINSEWVSYENFFYFFSDFGDYITSADSDVENIIYNKGDFGSFDTFGEKLVVAGDTEIALYTVSGREVFSYDNPIAKPLIETCDSYMIVYDSGAMEYRIYNLFTEIHKGNTEYPIYGAAIADNGSYALITGDGKHVSSVKIYNRRFDQKVTIGRASYVTDVSMTPSGDRVAILSYSQSKGEFTTHIYLSKTNKASPYADISVNGTFPIACAFSDDGYLNLVCKDRVLSYNTKGHLVTELMIPQGCLITDITVGKYGVGVLMSKDGISRALVLDESGKTVYDEILPERASEIELCGKYAYFLGDTNVLRLNLSETKYETALRDTDSEIYAMLLRNEDEVLLCMSSRVSYINFK